MSETEAFQVPGSDGRPVRAVRHGRPDAPPVLIAHGFKGFKGWGSFPWMAERLASAGLCAIRFDFSHNGVEAHDFDRLDLFLLDTPGRHQDDLRALAAHVGRPLGLLGHSRGGGDAVLFASENEQVEALVTLAAVSTTLFEPPGYETELREKGYVEIRNGRTGQQMPLGRAAFESGRALSIEDAARRLACPALFIHGTADASVPPTALDALAAWAPQAETLRIDGAGHTFGAVHPFAGPTPHLETALDAAARFFRTHLGSRTVSPTSGGGAGMAG